MSTLKLLLMASLGATSLSHTAGVHLQSGTNPIKLTGPNVIAPSSKNHVASPDATYTYTVTLDHAVGVNTVVNVGDVTDSAQPVVYSITIPAGQTIGTFDVAAVYSGDDLLTADSSGGADQMAVTVL